MRNRTFASRESFTMILEPRRSSDVGVGLAVNARGLTDSRRIFGAGSSTTVTGSVCDATSDPLQEAV